MSNVTKSNESREQRRRDASLLLSLPRETPITLTEAAGIAACSLRHLMAERSLGRGPKCYSLGRKAIRTTIGDVLAWSVSRPEVAQ